MSIIINYYYDVHCSHDVCVHTYKMKGGYRKSINKVTAADKCYMYHERKIVKAIPNTSNSLLRKNDIIKLQEKMYNNHYVHVRVVEMRLHIVH